jgi:TonB-dependent starch-binding outer membrane protein SusC
MNFTLAKLQRSLLKWKANAISLFKPVAMVLLLLIATISSYAQTSKPITGKITDETGAGLPGISVKVKNSTKGVSTDANGAYTIDAAEGAVLVISSVGFETSEIRIGKKSEYSTILKTLTSSLGQVIVVGYGTQKKTSLTGSVASVSSKTLNELPVASIDQALQGRIAGVSVVNNGSPGSSPIIAIRGISSINGTAEPLYVIDGFPTGSLNTFDNKDVESVEVLKDASAAAIYGSRATNGVILITTKKGKRNGRMQVNYESFMGFQNPSKKLSLLNTDQYVQFAKTLLGPTDFAAVDRFKPVNFNKPINSQTAQTFAQTNTNWQDEYFKKNAIITQHNVSASGGNEVSRFYFGAGYFNQDAITQGAGYKRGNFRINSDHIINKYITFGENLYLATADQRPDGSGGGSNRTPLANVIRMQPYIPVRNPDNEGGFAGPISSFDASDPTNPVEPALLQDNHSKQMKILGSAFVEISFTKWLKFRSTFGLDYSNNVGSSYTPIFDDKGTLSSPVASIGVSRQIYNTLLYTQQLSFNKDFGKHSVGATAVFETQGQTLKAEYQSGQQNNNTIRTLIGALNPSSGAYNSEWFLESYVGRVTYDYANKYLLSAALRRDGLSIWAPGNKFGTFPSASVGWRIDQEKFMQNLKAVSELKIRAGYGLTGLDGVKSLGAYPWQSLINVNNSSYPFGNVALSGLGSSYGNLSNKSLKWETTEQFNIGLDLGLFKNKITIVAEYFKKESDNLIIQVPTPYSFGFGGGGSLANVADLVNKGFEFQLGYHKTKGDFKWDATGLITTITNKVIKLDTDNASITRGGDPDFTSGADATKTEAGQSLQYFFGYVTDGIFQNADQVANSAFQAGGTRQGDIKFKDLNGDGKITDADRTNLGSYLPKFTYSLNLSANYQNFDISIFFQGSQGNKIFNGGRVLSEGMRRLFNASTEVLNSWTPANPNTSVPRAINGDPNGNARVSDRWIEDGSYLRLKNLMIGFTLPESTLKSLTKGAVSRFRIYVSSQNLLTFTQYKGWDPEVGSKNGTLTNGIDYGQYPSARSFQAGVQVGF